MTAPPIWTHQAAPFIHASGGKCGGRDTLQLEQTVPISLQVGGGTKCYRSLCTLRGRGSLRGLEHGLRHALPLGRLERQTDRVVSPAHGRTCAGSSRPRQ
jgi:hypothetical protein